MFGSPWERLTTDAPLGSQAVEDAAQTLRSHLTAREKVDLLSGDLSLREGVAMVRDYNVEPYPAASVPRLGIPGIRFTDGPRGVAVGSSTAFPVSVARGATFDPGLEERVGDAIGVEARAQGADLVAAVCVNLLRHPAWGRAQETYGEDSHHLGEMGAALVRGIQRHAMACVKHLACNSIERSRFRVDVRIDERDLRDLYLPQFRRCVDAGAASVMSAYNRVNGTWASHSRRLLTEVLKGDWGFDGFVMSDFLFAVRDGAAAVGAGLDLEMPMAIHLRRLGTHVARGRVPAARVDDAVLRLLRQQLRFAGTGQPERYRTSAVAGPEHRALAREVAQRSTVLLHNRAARGDTTPLLPLDLAATDRLAVVGKLAEVANTGDRGSSHVRAPEVVTILEGLRARHPRVEFDDGRDLDRAADAAGRAEVAVVVVGTTHQDEGEYLLWMGGDRSSLRLRPHDERLIRTVATANPRTVVVLVGGSAFVTEAWRTTVPALVAAWYPGMEGGHAVADVLAGDVDAGGRLPSTWPRDDQDLPPFDPTADEVHYGPLHGYRLLEATGRPPAYPFGHGTSYTTFEWGPLVTARTEDGGQHLRLQVTNTGPRSGDEVVQVYVDEVLGTDTAPRRTLRAFERVRLGAGEQRPVELRLGGALLDEVRDRTGRVTVHVGRSSRDLLATHELAGDA